MCRLAWIMIICLIHSYNSFGQPAYKNSYDSIRSYIDQDNYSNALPICDRIINADSTQMNAWYYKALCEEDLKHYPEAMRCFSKVAWFKEDNPRYWTSAGWYGLLSGQYDSARIYFEKAVGLVPEDYNNYLNLAHSYFLLKDQPRATYFYMLASEYMPNQDAHLQQVRVDLKLMDSLHQSWTTKSIVQIFEEDFKIAKSNTNSNIILDSIYSAATGERENNKDKLHELRIAFIEAQSKKEVKRWKVLRSFMYAIGRRKFHENDNRTALSYMKMAVNIDTALRDSISLFQWHFNFSRDVLDDEISKKIPNPRIEDAVYFAEEALRYAKEYKLDTDFFAAGWLQLANCYRVGSKHDSALFWYHKALPILPQKEEFGLYENTLYEIMQSHAAKRRNDSVDHYFILLDTRYLFGKDPHRRYIGMAANYHQILYERGEYANVISYCLRLAKWETDRSFPSPYTHRFFELAGLSHYKLNKKDSALLLLQQAISSFRSYITATKKNGEGNTIYLTDELYDAVFITKKLLAEKNLPDELFNLIEQSKESLLYDLLTFKGNPENTASIRTHQQQLPSNAVALSFTNCVDDVGYGIGFTNTEKLLVGHPINELETNARKLNHYKNISKLLTTSKDATPSTRSKMLPLISYLQVSGYLTASRGTIVKNKAADSSALTDEARVAMSKLLYNFYIKPYQALLKDKEVIYISPDLFLNYIPFETLIDEDGVFMGEKYRIIYVPSFTIKSILEKKTYADTKTLVVFGNPDYKTYQPEKLQGRAWDYAFSGNIRSWNELPGTQKELAMLSQLVPGSKIFQQGNLSETLLKKLNKEEKLESAGILHFALHGLTNINAGADDNTLIITEKGEGTEDGFLQFWEIYNLKIKPRLAFLSACETAFGFPNKDGSSTSMVTAFLGAGAGSCIGTNWKISDEATTVFINEFYKLVLRGTEFPEALRLVRKKFISGEMGKDYQLPYYWAAFKYYGF
jgi:CHAT domain-containing protein